VDLTWKGGRLAEATLRSAGGGEAKIRYGGKVVTQKIGAGQTVKLGADLAVLR
jgi:hypothetical protein